MSRANAHVAQSLQPRVDFNVTRACKIDLTIRYVTDLIHSSNKKFLLIIENHSKTSDHEAKKPPIMEPKAFNYEARSSNYRDEQ